MMTNDPKEDFRSNGGGAPNIKSGYSTYLVELDGLEYEVYAEMMTDYREDTPDKVFENLEGLEEYVVVTGRAIDYEGITTIDKQKITKEMKDKIIQHLRFWLETPEFKLVVENEDFVECEEYEEDENGIIK